MGISHALVSVTGHQGWLLTGTPRLDRFWQAGRPVVGTGRRSLNERTVPMLRSSFSRRFLVLAASAVVGTGLGLGAVAVWATSGADAQQAPRLAAATAPVSRPMPAAPAAPAPAPAMAPASVPLTADQAQAVATQASPGTVLEVDQDTEPTGLVYDVKIQHADGTETKVEVDATTGQVISAQNEDTADGTDPAGRD